jgi:hypothetical protein
VPGFEIKRKIREILTAAAGQYPPELIVQQRIDIPRITFNISLSLGLGSAPFSDDCCKSFEVCDIGGGVGLFSVGCAALGVKRSVLIDDFNDAINHQNRTNDSRYSSELRSRSGVA